MHPPGQLGPAHYHLTRYQEMCDARRPVEEWWQIISEYVLPRKSYVTETEDFVDDSRYRRLYDTTAIDACQTLANGHSSYITPGDSRWFFWSAPDHIYTDESESWYRKCSEIAALELASSNFYTTVDEGYLDRSGFGLSNISVWPGRQNTLHCRIHPINSYCLEEGEEGTVDTVYLCMEKGIRQLRQMFGEAIEKSEVLRKSYQDYVESGRNREHKVIHAIYPREEKDRQRGSKEGRHLPIASVYICEKGKTIIHESGFEEMPYCVSRYLKHTGRGNQYGFSPAWRAMPAISQLNFLQKALDLVAEKQAVPPVLVPDYLEGEVDLRAGGMTMFRASRTKGAYALPQEWANQGRYDVGVDRAKHKQEEINKAFHADLFRMFNLLSEQGSSPPTATQIAEMSGEKMIQFSPSFTRWVSDFQVFMRRVFALLLRAGKLPPPPPDAIEQAMDGTLSVPDPKVIYQSKIALALQQLQNSGIDRLLERAALLVESGHPEVLDNLDLDRTMRTIGRNDGVPEEIFTPEELVAEIRERRQEQMEQERQLAMAGEAAQAAGAVGLNLGESAG